MTMLSGAPLTTDSIPRFSGSAPGVETELSFRGRPGVVAVASDGTVLVSDPLGATIWQVTDGQMTPAVERSRNGVNPANVQPVRPLTPSGIAFGPDGTLYVADPSGQRVCAVAPGGLVRVVAGGANGYRDGPGAGAQFRYPSNVAIAADGTLHVADTGNDRIRRITPDGNVTTLAGSIYDYGDGRGSHGRFRRRGVLRIDAHGTCYVAGAGNNVVRAISPDGDVVTRVGSPPGGDHDGAGADVGLRWPSGISVGSRGGVWVADHGNGAVRRIDTTTGVSETALRLDGPRWPTSVARYADDTVVVASAELLDVHAPHAVILVIAARDEYRRRTSRSDRYPALPRHRPAIRGRPHPFRLTISIETTGSPVPCQRLRRVHTPPLHRASPGPHAGSSPATGTTLACRCPEAMGRPRFRCRCCLSRCVSSGSHMFVFSSHT
jgi:sugar lactone lactonase YvrE